MTASGHLRNLTSNVNFKIARLGNKTFYEFLPSPEIFTLFRHQINQSEYTRCWHVISHICYHKKETSNINVIGCQCVNVADFISLAFWGFSKSTSLLRLLIIYWGLHQKHSVIWVRIFLLKGPNICAHPTCLMTWKGWIDLQLLNSYTIVTIRSEKTCKFYAYFCYSFQRPLTFFFFFHFSALFFLSSFFNVHKAITNMCL